MRVLIAGETWSTHKIEIKGFSAYTTSAYDVGLTELVEALTAHGHEVEHIANHEAIERFPWTLEEFEAHDVIIMSDIPADTIQLHPAVFDRGERKPDRLRVLADYVRGGGGALMVGGYMSFSGIEGKARYQTTPLAAVLPVRMLGMDDRIESPEGVNPSVVEQHEILRDIPSEWPYFLGYNRIEAKPDATVLMTVDEDPFLVIGVAGEGRTAAFASDCSPHWGSPEFLAWPHYGTFWSQLIAWLGGGRAAQ
jgi:uncharacterized membrane protein